jgi:5-methylcytosine-specific restriction endonuclease McrA
VTKPRLTTSQVFRVLLRDHYTCAYCEFPAVGVDPVVPFRGGGSDADGNLVAVCERCRSFATGPATFTGLADKREYILARRRPEIARLRK